MIKLTSAAHPLIKRFVKLRESSRYRESEGSVIIEGKTMVSEFAARAPLTTILATDEAFIPPGNTAAYLVTETLLNKVAGSKHPDGIVAEAPMPPWSPLKGIKRLLVLDQVSDPGNLGALLRSALALGWQGAFLIDGCCDPYNDKALRAAKGATFRLPLAAGSWKQLEELAYDRSLTAFSAEMGGTPVEELEAEGGIMLVLGNEARGISGQARAFCRPVAVPMEGEMESLNVTAAGAILLYTIRNRLHGS